MSDKIDGKWKTWNPVIGCLHNCSAHGDWGVLAKAYQFSTSDLT